MHIKNSDFTEHSGDVAHILPRQICDLTNLKGCKFGSLSYRSEIALYFATILYAHRCATFPKSDEPINFAC